MLYTVLYLAQRLVLPEQGADLYRAARRKLLAGDRDAHWPEHHPVFDTLLFNKAEKRRIDVLAGSVLNLREDRQRALKRRAC